MKARFHAWCLRVEGRTKKTKKVERRGQVDEVEMLEKKKRATKGRETDKKREQRFRESLGPTPEKSQRDQNRTGRIWKDEHGSLQKKTGDSEV